MGTPDFSVPTLKALIESEHDIIGVITQPDKPKGRGKKIVFSPVKEVALKNNIPVFQPKKVKDKDFIEILKNLAPDIIVVIAFGQILSKEILDLPPYGCINVHASLLPKYRGAGPIQWAIINGEEKTGITTMYMDIGLDTGDIILKDEVIIEEKETGGSLHDKLSELGANTLIRTINAIKNGTAPRVPQNNNNSTYAPMLNKKLGQIDWTKDAISIERLVRGLNPWPSAYTYLQKKILKIWEANIITIGTEMEPGTIVEVTKNNIIVQTGKGALSIKELQLQGKKRMRTEEFLRGYSVTVKDKIG